MIDGGVPTGNRVGEGLRLKSRKPHRYYKTPQETVDLVLELRRTKHWGPNKIEGYLRNYRAEGVKPVSHRTIHRILVQARLNNPIAIPRRVWGKHRFEREHSNSLWQADYKLTMNDEWMMSILDDHSRFIPGSRIHHNPTAEHAIRLLGESVKRYGWPDQVLTDRGTQFYPARDGQSMFTEYCTGNGIQHIHTRRRRNRWEDSRHLQRRSQPPSLFFQHSSAEARRTYERGCSFNRGAEHFAHDSMPPGLLLFPYSRAFRERPLPPPSRGRPEYVA